MVAKTILCENKSVNAVLLKPAPGVKINALKKLLKPEFGCHWNAAAKFYSCPINLEAELKDIFKSKKLNVFLQPFQDEYFNKSLQQKQADKILDEAALKREKLINLERCLMIEESAFEEDVTKHELPADNPTAIKMRAQLELKRLEIGDLREEIEQLHLCAGIFEDDESDDWQDPRPIEAPLRKVPLFDSETLLPAPLGNWVMDEADRMPCPPEYVAATAIVALGSVIGAKCAIKPKAFDDWQIIPNLWGGIVGLPSTKKSPAISSALKPLDNLSKDALEAHKTNLEEFETTKMIFEAKRDSLKGRIKKAADDPAKGNLDLLSQELQNHLHEEPCEPTPRRYKTNDSTIEKLGELLRDNPGGLLLVRDELVGLLASWDRPDRGGDRSFFLEGWNGDSSFSTDRIARGSIFIPNLTISIFGGIQPDKLIGYLEQCANALANDGLLQRFQLLVFPDHFPWAWRDRKPDQEARKHVMAIFDAMANLEPETWGATPSFDTNKPPAFHFDQYAQEIFIEWSYDLHQRRIPSEDNPLIMQHLCKYDKLFPALALIFHLIDCASSGIRGTVRKESALRAAAWCEFLEAHARKCYSLIADDGLRSAQALAEKLQQDKLQNGFSARDIRRNQWRYLTGDDAVQGALIWLEDDGWIKAYPVGGTGPGTGRATLRYRINPKIAKAKNFE